MASRDPGAGRAQRRFAVGSKDALRETVRARRAARSPAERAAADAARTALVLAALEVVGAEPVDVSRRTRPDSQAPDHAAAESAHDADLHASPPHSSPSPDRTATVSEGTRGASREKALDPAGNVPGVPSARGGSGEGADRPRRPAEADARGLLAEPDLRGPLTGADPGGRLAGTSRIVVAAYASIGAEPGTLDLVAALAAQAPVLLPVLSASASGPRRTPAWAWHDGRPLRPGLWGIPEPTGEPLGAEAVARADLVILPGLAGTSGGERLGTGGGWYDRALVGSTAPRWLLLYDDELLDSVPVDPWDLPVTRIITETRVVDCG